MPGQSENESESEWEFETESESESEIIVKMIKTSTYYCQGRRY